MCRVDFQLIGPKTGEPPQIDVDRRGAAGFNTVNHTKRLTCCCVQVVQTERVT